MKNCLITYYTTTENVGAIYINTELTLNINDTTFYQCYTSVKGGNFFIMVLVTNFNIK